MALQILEDISQKRTGCRVWVMGAVKNEFHGELARREDATYKHKLYLRAYKKPRFLES